MGDEILLTKEGHAQLTEELEELTSVRRLEVAARLKEAMAYGDLSENAEYDAAKDEQAEMEIRISKIENTLRKAKVINENEINDDVVNVGLHVKVKNLKSKESSDFQLVGSAESDPLQGRISNDSIVGKALMGKKIGDKIEIVVPDGPVAFEIIDIKK